MSCVGACISASDRLSLLSVVTSASDGSSPVSVLFAGIIEGVGVELIAGFCTDWIVGDAVEVGIEGCGVAVGVGLLIPVHPEVMIIPSTKRIVRILAAYFIFILHLEK